jgi:hypothetical protein
MGNSYKKSGKAGLKSQSLPLTGCSSMDRLQDRLQDQIQNLVNEYKEKIHQGVNPYFSEVEGPSWSSAQDLEAFIQPLPPGSPSSPSSPVPPPPPPPPPLLAAPLPITNPAPEEVIPDVKGKRTRGGGGLVEDTKRRRVATVKGTSSRGGDSKGQQGGAKGAEVVIGTSPVSPRRGGVTQGLSRLIEGPARTALFNHLVTVNDRQSTQAEKLYKLEIGCVVIYDIYFLFRLM